MPPFNPKTNPIWNRLVQHADIMNLPEKHLKQLLADHHRLGRFSLKAAGIFYDFSRQRIEEKTLDLLIELAEFRNLKQRFADMVNGKKVNVTEDRPALHTAARNFSDDPVRVDGKDVMPSIHLRQAFMREKSLDPQESHLIPRSLSESEGRTSGPNSWPLHLMPWQIKI